MCIYIYKKREKREESRDQKKTFSGESFSRTLRSWTSARESVCFPAAPVGGGETFSTAGVRNVRRKFGGKLPMFMLPLPLDRRQRERERGMSERERVEGGS